MKYLITESKLETAIQKYLDSLNLLPVRISPKRTTSLLASKEKGILFIKSDVDDLARMRYFSWDGKLMILWDFIEEICNFFSIDEDDAHIYISEWVENQIGKEIDIFNVSTVGGMIAGSFLDINQG